MNKKDNTYIVRIYHKNKLLYKELVDISDIQFNDGIEDYLKYVRIDIHKTPNTYIHKNIINKNVMLSGTITCLANNNNSKISSL